jgi:hypothetical protein
MAGLHTPLRQGPGYPGFRRIILLRKQPLQQRQGNSITIQASFLGVGAPEAILVGVVALVVFGPKGLAQVSN